MSTGTYKELRDGGGLEAQVQWRPGHTVKIVLGWDQRWQEKRMTDKTPGSSAQKILK